MICTTNCFFFSSRRRHTRLQGDWSSDVCSSDLHRPRTDFDDLRDAARAWFTTIASTYYLETSIPLSPQIVGRSEERRVGKSVDLGGRRIIKKKKKKKRRRLVA